MTIRRITIPLQGPIPPLLAARNADIAAVFFALISINGVDDVL